MIADFNEVINSDLESLILKNQLANQEIHEAQGNYDIIGGLDDMTALPESQAKEIQMQTRIGVL